TTPSRDSTWARFDFSSRETDQRPELPNGATVSEKTAERHASGALHFWDIRGWQRPRRAGLPGRPQTPRATSPLQLGVIGPVVSASPLTGATLREPSNRPNPGRAPNGYAKSERHQVPKEPRQAKPKGGQHPRRPRKNLAFAKQACTSNFNGILGRPAPAHTLCMYISSLATHYSPLKNRKTTVESKLVRAGNRKHAFTRQSRNAKALTSTHHNPDSCRQPTRSRLLFGAHWC
ncbi:hypothetical protein AAFF_G00151560, partial [Aldrovandia affinis]